MKPRGSALGTTAIRGRLRARDRSSSGAAAVELAVVLLLLVTMIYAIVDLGHMAALAIRVQNAARAGAQFGGVSKDNATNTSAVVTATKNSAPGLASVMTVTVTSFCACSSAPSANVTCTTTCATGATRLMYSSVQVSVPNTPVLPWRIFIRSWPATVTGNAIMQISL